MTDRPIYPYYPGVIGIAPEHFQPGANALYGFYSESGNPLQVFKSPDSVEITVPDDFTDDFRLKASIHNEELSLSLRTKGFKRRTHDDFYAKPFIELAVSELFEGRFKIIKGAWLSYEDSDNFKLYARSREGGLTKSEAANQTWTGRFIEKYGYQVRSDRDVYEQGGLREDGASVFALFKPTPISWQQSLLRALRVLQRR